MLFILTTRNGPTVTMVIAACCLMCVVPQGRDHLNLKPAVEPGLIYLADSSQAPNTPPQQTPPIASPSIEPELNDLGAELEAQALEALKLFAAPKPEEIPEPAPGKP